jgi:hypothetical protein
MDKLQFKRVVMSRISRRSVGITKTICAVMLFAATFFPAIASGQEEHTKLHGFWVAGSATVTVKADEAVAFRVVRGSGRTAAEALAQNERITGDVVRALERMGLNGKYRFSGNHYSSGGAPALGLGVRPYAFDARGQQQPPGFEVTKYAFVTFDEADLANPAFDDRLAATLDGLAEAGAQQPEMAPQFAQLKITSPVLFTVKDPRPALFEALRQAEERAKSLGQEVARNSGVKLGKIIDARVNRPLEVALPRLQEPNVLEELHLQYYSTTKEGVTFSSTFAVEYSTK